MILTHDRGSKIRICSEQAAHPEAQWKEDGPSSGSCMDLTGIRGRGGFLLNSHISPDGRHIMICTDSRIKICEFKLEEQDIKGKFNDADPLE